MTTRTFGRSKWRRTAGPAALAAVLVAVLWVPWPEPAPPPAGVGTPFVWSQDERWRALEAAFGRARSAGCHSLAPGIGEGFAEGHRLLADAAARPLGPDAPVFAEIERAVFELGPMTAACPERIPEYVELAARMRSVVKDQSRRWDMGSAAARDRLYRLLYGGRGAVEEAMLQAPARRRAGPHRGATTSPRPRPAAEVQGVRDPQRRHPRLPRRRADLRADRARQRLPRQLLARGARPRGLAPPGAPRSSRRTSSGASRSPPSPSTSRDVKLRVMVLRLRADLPRLAADPMLPHRAARAALARGPPPPHPVRLRDGLRRPLASCSARRWPRRRTRGSDHALDGALAPSRRRGSRRWLARSACATSRPRSRPTWSTTRSSRVVAEWRDPAGAVRGPRGQRGGGRHARGGRGRAIRSPTRLRWLPVARLAKAYSGSSTVWGLWVRCRRGSRPPGRCATDSSPVPMRRSRQGCCGWRRSSRAGKGTARRTGS